MFQKVAEDSLIDITGRTWNRMVALLETIESKNKQSPPNPPINREVRVQNCVGRNIAPFEIIKLGDPLPLPGEHNQDLAYQFQNVFKGEATDGKTELFAVCQVGIPSDVGNGNKGIGRAIVQGVTTALVDVTNAAHKYARPSGTDGQLESSGDVTGARILYSQSTGLQKCKVLLGATGGSDHFCVKMTKIDGDNGSDESQNTYVYDVMDLAGEVLATGMTVPYPGVLHGYQTFELGEVDPATEGEARYNENGVLVIKDCNEVLRLGACEDSPAGEKKCTDPISGLPIECKKIPSPITTGSSFSYRIVFLDGDRLIVAAEPKVEGEFVEIIITTDGVESFNGFVPSTGGSVFYRDGDSVSVHLQTFGTAGARNPATFSIGVPVTHDCGCHGTTIVATQTTELATETEEEVYATEW